MLGQIWGWLLSGLGKLFGGKGGQSQTGWRNQTASGNSAPVANAGRDVIQLVGGLPRIEEDCLSQDAILKAEKAIAVHVLASGGMPKSKESIFAKLEEGGFHNTTLEAALLNLRSRELIVVQERVEVSRPSPSMIAELPDDVFLTPIPRPEPQEYRWEFSCRSQAWRSCSNEPISAPRDAPGGEIDPVCTDGRSRDRF